MHDETTCGCGHHLEEKKNSNILRYEVNDVVWYINTETKMFVDIFKKDEHMVDLANWTAYLELYEDNGDLLLKVDGITRRIKALDRVQP